MKESYWVNDGIVGTQMWPEEWGYWVKEITCAESRAKRVEFYDDLGALVLNSDRLGFKFSFCLWIVCSLIKALKIAQNLKSCEFMRSKILDRINIKITKTKIVWCFWELMPAFVQSRDIKCLFLKRGLREKNNREIPNSLNVIVATRIFIFIFEVVLSTSSISSAGVLCLSSYWTLENKRFARTELQQWNSVPLTFWISPEDWCSFSVFPCLSQTHI